jgi:GNAT superfamily N-acetyltransferase
MVREDETPMSRPFTLRPATPGDAGAIALIWHDGWRDGHLGHVPDALHEHRRPAHFASRVPPRIPHTTVATIEGAVVGFVTVHGDEVEQVYVSADARGAGVADALLAAAERRIAEHSGSAWLAVVAGNARARRFYERNGWRDAGGFDYPAEIPQGTLLVPARRYEKRVGRDDAGGAPRR